jgi:hypothetical protein
MITSTFINLFYNLVNKLVGLLPDISLTSSFSDAIITASSYISAINNFIPSVVLAILAVVTIDIAFETGYLAFKIVYWIIKRFPTQS